MGWWQLNTDALAASRFTISELSEATGCLFALVRNTAAHPAEHAWLDAHLPAFRDRLARDPVTALLSRAVLGTNTRWIADFATQTPTPGADMTFERELARTRETPPDRARANLEVSVGGPLPALLRRDDLAERYADLVEWVWHETVLPCWPHRRRIFEADILARTSRISQGGWATMLEGMRPGMRWLGEGRLQVNPLDFPPREVSGTELYFVPITAGRGWVAWDDQGRYAVIYPCSGVLAESATASKALGRLLGQARAGVLVLLEEPKTTTQLVALTGQGLGSVGRHLKVLNDAGLIARRRAGRSVLYYRTAVGDVLCGDRNEA